MRGTEFILFLGKTKVPVLCFVIINDYLWFPCPCIVVCTSEEVDSSSSLYRLSLEGKALYIETMQRAWFIARSAAGIWRWAGVVSKCTSYLTPLRRTHSLHIRGKPWSLNLWYKTWNLWLRCQNPHGWIRTMSLWRPIQHQPWSSGPGTQVCRNGMDYGSLRVRPSTWVYNASSGPWVHRHWF